MRLSLTPDGDFRHRLFTPPDVEADERFDDDDDGDEPAASFSFSVSTSL